MAERHIKLGLFLWTGGHHIAAWRHPDVPPTAGANFGSCVQLAQTAEQALFDFVFAADFATVRQGDPEVVSRNALVAGLEPFSLMTALAAVTKKIGLVCTSSTTYDEPYHVARRFASLDLISGGRAGWNLVTSVNPSEAPNFGRETHLAHDERYRRAREFANVVRGLWDSWEDDAFTYDKSSGRYFDPAKVHVLNHRGQYFNVRGPLNVSRSPQGQPVMVQAGSSEVGKELAAETAEMAFTAQQSLADAKAFYSDLKSRMSKYDREPGEMIVLPGISPIVGRTTSEAREKFDALQALVHPAVGLNLISGFLGIDLSAYPVDGPLPELPPSALDTSRKVLLRDLAKRENLTIRQLYLRIAGARGHRQLVGSATEIADELESWFREGGADGFNLMPPTLPGSLNDFIELVVPLLQERGLFRKGYEGNTLRDHLGLRQPINRFNPHLRETAP